MKLVTNNVPRPVAYGCELTPKERAEFDYLDDIDGARFVRYKGCVYDLGEFMHIDARIAPHPQRPGWEKFDGYSSDSIFSGVLVRYCGDTDYVVLAAYFC